MTHSSETSEDRCIMKNKKCLDLDVFLDTIISFSHLKKRIHFRFVYKQ